MSMQLIAKVSRGSRMDQIYIPKQRLGLPSGSHVLVQPLSTEKTPEQPYFYHVNHLEPVKIHLIQEIFQIIDKNAETIDNILITGSFLEKGFQFNDIDVIIVTDEKPSEKHLKAVIEAQLSIPAHLILISKQALIRGMATDPLYQMMVSRCVAKKRFVHNVKREFNYKLLDLHLLKSEMLVENFEMLSGGEKYYLTRNMIAISLFLQNKGVTHTSVNEEIIRIFHLESIDKIRQNMIEKKPFADTYKRIYEATFNTILDRIEHDSKKEKAHQSISWLMKC